MTWEQIVSKIIATTLLTLEEGSAAITNPASLPQDVAAEVSGVLQIWFTVTAAKAATGAQTPLVLAYNAHMEARKAAEEKLAAVPA